MSLTFPRASRLAAQDTTSCHRVREALHRSVLRSKVFEAAEPYLRRCISGALQHHPRDRVRLVRVPKRVHEAGDYPLGYSSLDASFAGEQCLLDQLASPEQEAAGTGPAPVEPDPSIDPEQNPEDAALGFPRFCGLLLKQLSK